MATSRFSGEISAAYERYLVPMLFEPNAGVLAQRIPPGVTRVLEVASGTGVLTRALLAALPRTASIVATDLSPHMLEEAARIGTARPVAWQQADAERLPFPAGEFDIVVCQFGVMFFPDKRTAFAEARRVLRPGGQFLFSVWDRIEDNDLAAEVDGAVASLFPDDPPSFMARVPHGYFDRRTIADDLAAAGFGASPEFTPVTLRSRAPDPASVAIAFCQGTPLRTEIESRAAYRLAEATDAVERAVAAKHGPGFVDAKMQAFLVSVRK